MAKWDAGNGIEKYIEQLQKLTDNTELILKKGLFDGAAEMADSFRSEIQGIPESSCSQREKEGLLNGLTIAKFQDSNGMVHTRIGMAGYNDLISKKYPQGHPNAMIARSINVGTSFRQPYPFIKRAANSAKSKVNEAIKKTVESEIEKLMK